MSHCGINTLPTELSHSLFETRVAGNYANFIHIFHFFMALFPQKNASPRNRRDGWIDELCVPGFAAPNMLPIFFTSVYVGFYHACNNTQCKGRLRYVIYWLE